MVISISGGSVVNDGLLRNQNRLHLRQHRRHDFNWRHPRQRRSDDRRVDLVVDLLRHVRFDGSLIDSRSKAPAEDLFLRQVFVRREVLAWRSERAGAIASAAVLILRAVASPIGGNHNVRETAFGRFAEKAFDDPREGNHGILGEGQVGNTGNTIGAAIREAEVGVAGGVDGKLAVGGQRCGGV